MRKKDFFNCIMTTFFSCLFFSQIGISALAQSSDDEDSRKRNFGSSLNKKSKKSRSGREKEIKPVRSVQPEDEVIRIETTLIVSDVLVFDKNNAVVKNLNKEDFIIIEDDKTQEIEVFLTGNSQAIPRSIVLIIDYSASQLPYIKTSIEAAKILVDKLNPQDRMAIVTDNVELLQDFTTDKSLLKEKLEALKKKALAGTTGHSRQYSALMATLGEMFAGETLRPIIIFQTDGDELSLLKDKAANFSLKNKTKINFSYEDVLTAAERSRATVYTIIPGFRLLGIKENERMNKAKLYLENIEKAFAELRNIAFQPEKVRANSVFLKLSAEAYYRQQSAIDEIAKRTGGWTDYLEQPEQADKVYSDILSEMNQRYILGYYPVNQERDGKKREVKIAVRGRPEYTVWGRKSYILSEEKK